MTKTHLATLCVAALLAPCASIGQTSTKAALVSLDEALVNAVEDIGSKVQGKVEIAIVELKAPTDEASDFLIAELSAHMIASGKFNVLARGKMLVPINEEHKLQMSGLVNDSSAVGVGHHLGAKVVTTGTLTCFAGFSQLRVRAIDVKSSQVLAMYTARIKPKDKILAGILRLDGTKFTAITDEALAHLNNGDALFRAGKLDEAIRAFGQALAVNRKLAEAYLYRGFVYAVKGNYDQAIADFNAALKIKPDYYEALSIRGVAYAKKGDYDRAIADFNAALKIKPDYDEALSNRGNVYSKKGDYDRAFADFSAALKNQPDCYDALNNRGVAYFNKGDYDRAIADYNAALKIKPDYYDALSNRGYVYFKKGDYDRAIADFNAALRIGPEYYAALSNRGNAYSNKGDYARAL
ncbi:MAG: tetratricopeptide repeat protein, partial [Chitinispirillales bacterium]|nr:tetratricopeptide repeat protein [Chitinispirillales bacterium]